MGPSGFIQKLISSLLIGISIALLFPLGRMILSESNGMLKEAIYLNSQVLLSHWPIALGVALITFFLTKKALTKFFFAGLALFAVVVLMYLYVPDGPISEWLPARPNLP